MDFFKGFFYRSGDPDTADHFAKYGMKMFGIEHIVILILMFAAVITMLVFLTKKASSTSTSKPR